MRRTDAALTRCAYYFSTEKRKKDAFSFLSEDGHSRQKMDTEFPTILSKDCGIFV